MTRPKATSRRSSSSAPSADAAATPTSPSARASSSPGTTKALGNLASRGLAEVAGRDVRLAQEGLATFVCHLSMSNARRTASWTFVALPPFRREKDVDKS